MNYDSVYVNAGGRTSRAHFIGAVITLLLVVAVYTFFAKGRNGQWCLLTLLFPAVVLHARRLHDIGQSAWLLLAPGAVIAASLWLRMVSPGTTLEVATTYAALAVAAACVVAGMVAKGQDEPNRFGEPAAA